VPGSLPDALGSIALLLVAAIVVAIGVALGISSRELTNPPGYVHQPGATALPASSTGTDPRRDFGLQAEDVSFRTADGSTLRGWLVPAAQREACRDRSVGVVTVHGRGGDRRDFLRHLPMLHELCASTLLFDLRDHGLSDGSARGMSMGYRESQDIRAAVHFLKDSGVRRVAVLGVSLGAGSAILAAAADPSIDAVIAEAPFSSMEAYIQQMSDQAAASGGVRRVLQPPPWWPRALIAFTAWRVGAQDLRAPIDVVDRIAPRPLVLIHGTADTAFVPDHAQRLAQRTGGSAVLWLAEGAEHTRVFDSYPDQYRTHIAAIVHQLAAG
jgi:pimeloyl-ACP methyl ester carboxylesterase